MFVVGRTVGRVWVVAGGGAGIYLAKGAERMGKLRIAWGLWSFRGGGAARWLGQKKKGPEGVGRGMRVGPLWVIGSSSHLGLKPACFQFLGSRGSRTWVRGRRGIFGVRFRLFVELIMRREELKESVRKVRVVVA